MEDLINVYELIDTTTTTSTIKKPSFNYEKPKGWDGKRAPAPKQKKQKMNIFKVIWKGLCDDEFEDVKNQRRYDLFMENLKLYLMTSFFAILMIETALHTGISSETYDPDRKMTFSEKALDNVINVIKGEKKKPIVVPRKDTIYLPAQ